MQIFKEYLNKNTDLSEKVINSITQNLRVENIKKGNRLLNAGEVCSFSFFIEKGLLRMYSINELGKEQIIQFAPENWLVSDRSSSYFSKASDFYIDAIEDSEIIFISKDFMDLAAEKHDSFRVFFEKLLHNHIRHMQKRISLLLGATAEQRYMDFIKLYPDLMLRVPQWMIASYLGVTPESLSRVRKELAKKHFKV
jgi:CRP-like cAMP-binding protein